jgi:hypothetical protein
MEEVGNGRSVGPQATEAGGAFEARHLADAEMRVAWEQVLSSVEKQRFQKHLELTIARSVSPQVLEAARREYRVVEAQQRILEAKHAQWAAAHPEPDPVEEREYETRPALHPAVAEEYLKAVARPEPLAAGARIALPGDR